MDTMKEILKECVTGFASCKWKRLTDTVEDIEIEKRITARSASMLMSYRMVLVATRGMEKEIERHVVDWIMYRGFLQDGSRVAVKVFAENTHEAYRKFLKEIDTHTLLRHKNILNLQGICAEKKHHALLYEYAANGSLNSWLYGDLEKRRLLSWKIRYGILLQLAKGIEYLHYHASRSIVHHDLNPRNIYLDKNFNPKICGFGQCEHLHRDGKRVVLGESIYGSAGYMAPEVMPGYFIDPSADVFSFGVVVLDTVRGKRSYFFVRDKDRDDVPSLALANVNNDQVDKVVDEVCEWKSDDKVQRLQAVNAVKVAVWCMQKDPRMRPSMPKVVRMLEGFLAVLDPPAP